jgi:hypothetical protein
MEDQREGPEGCSKPPALGELALIAAVDGEADEATVAHLRACQHCATRAREFADLQGLLRKRLYRMFCPTSEDLAAFHQGMLDHDQRKSVSDHVNDCPHCSRELRLLTEALGLPPPTRSPPAPAVRRIAARLIAPRPLMPLAAYGPMRGASVSTQYAYQAENIQLMLDIERAATRPGRLLLLGLLLLDEPLPAGLQHATVSLQRGETIVGNSRLDDLGNFTLDNLTPGQYRLALNLPDREIVVESLVL